MTNAMNPTGKSVNARGAQGLRCLIEWRQIGLLTRQQRISAFVGIPVIAVTMLLAQHTANTRWLEVVALTRLAIYIFDNMLARDVQDELARGENRSSRKTQLIVNIGIANLFWAAFTWPLVIGETIDFMAFLLAIIALFAVCLATVSANFHPSALTASALGGCLGLAPKIYVVSTTVGVLLPLCFIVYCIGIYYFAHELGRQSRAGIVLEIRRRLMAQRLSATNDALEQALTKANYLADQDALTRLRNRRAFENQLERFKQDWPDRDCYLMLIDVDHFKRINDRFGHEMGDGVLVAIGGALSQWEFEGDARLTGRWGGEEFIALAALDRTWSPGEMADDLRARIEELAEALHWPAPIELSASIGCAPLIELADFDESLRRADSALYAAKNAGRNCWKLAA